MCEPMHDNTACALNLNSLCPKQFCRLEFISSIPFVDDSYERHRKKGIGSDILF